MTDPGLDLPADEAQSPNYPYATAREGFVAVRKPDANGTVVAKFVNASRLPKALHDYDGFVVTYPGSQNALNALDVDHPSADLTDEEREVLEQCGYPIGVDETG